METSSKFIFAFVLLMLSFCMSGSAMNLENSTSDCECCQLSESSDNDCTSTFVSDSSVLNASQVFSDLEMNIRFIETSTSSNSRIRRFVEINIFLKDVMRKFSLIRDNSLVLDQSKSYYSDKDPYYSIITNEYYIFALRRILI